jgi:hypothetical protein
MNRITGLTLLAVALICCPALPGASPSEAGSRWEYKTLTKDQILSLGKKGLDAGLNLLGDDGWELAAVDGVYIFKRSKSLAGKRVQDLKDEIKIIEADVEQQKDRLAWSERMGRKGFLAENQIKFERDYLNRLELVLARARRDLEALPKDNREPEPAPAPKPKSEK